MSDYIVNKDELRSLRIFRDLPEDEIIKLGSCLTISRYNTNEQIFREGETGEIFFILRNGIINILKQVNGESEIVNIINIPGDFFGEMSLLEDKPRSAGAIAATDCELFILSKDKFLELVKEYPQLSMHLVISVSNFLRSTDNNLVAKLKAKNAEVLQAYSDLKKMQDELIKKERLSAVGKFASSIIHDIKNPMTVIRGYAQLINESNLPPNKIKDYSRIILGEVDRFVSMAQDLLSFSKGDSKLNINRKSIVKEIDSLLYSMKNSLEQRKIKIETNLDFDCEINLDAQKILRAMENIVFNALDAMQDGGILTISTEKSGKFAAIRFKDSGCGMPVEIRSKIFDAFYSYNKNHGTGLGLAFAKKIVEDHYGRIELESELGKGSCFTILLPIE